MRGGAQAGRAMDTNTVEITVKAYLIPLP